MQVRSFCCSHKSSFVTLNAAIFTYSMQLDCERLCVYRLLVIESACFTPAITNSTDINKPESARLLLISHLFLECVPRDPSVYLKVTAGPRCGVFNPDDSFVLICMARRVFKEASLFMFNENACYKQMWKKEQSWLEPSQPLTWLQFTSCTDSFSFCF